MSRREGDVSHPSEAIPGRQRFHRPNERAREVAPRRAWRARRGAKNLERQRDWVPGPAYHDRRLAKRLDNGETVSIEAEAFAFPQHHVPRGTFLRKPCDALMQAQ